MWRPSAAGHSAVHENKSQASLRRDLGEKDQNWALADSAKGKKKKKNLRQVVHITERHWHRGTGRSVEKMIENDSYEKLREKKEETWKNMANFNSPPPNTNARKNV